MSISGKSKQIVHVHFGAFRTLTVFSATEIPFPWPIDCTQVASEFGNETFKYTSPFPCTYSQLQITLWLSEQYVIAPVMSMAFGTFAGCDDTLLKPSYGDSYSLGILSRLLCVIRKALIHKIEPPNECGQFLDKLLPRLNNSDSSEWQRWEKGFRKQFEDQRRIMAAML